MLNQGQQAIATDPENSGRERATDQPLHRRRFRRQTLGQCRCHSGGDRLAATQAAGQDRADAAADLSRHDASFRHHPASPPGHRSATAASSRSATMCSLAICPASRPMRARRCKPARFMQDANRLTRHRLAPLDIPVASSMRAPGEAVGLMALECAMDELAEKLDLDPIELRIRNEPSEDPEQHIPYSSRHLIACLQEGARRFGWDKRNAKPGQVRDGRWLVGMGVAAATRGNPLRLSKANVRLDAGRHRHRANGDDRYRHRHLHHSGSDHRRDARPADRASPRRIG